MNAGRLALAGVIVVVVAAIVAGLVISGSPGEQRQLRADDARVTHMRQLSGAIQRFYRETRMLPPDLETLLNGWASSEIPQDPVTDEPYGYELVSPRSYRLCASFARPSTTDTLQEFWSHEAGQQCYFFDYSDLVLD